jgi:hypothetical protein
MPTQEERLTILEYDLKQYKTETIKAYGEMAIEMMMVKGLKVVSLHLPVFRPNTLIQLFHYTDE